MDKKDFRSYGFVVEFSSFVEAGNTIEIVLLRSANGQPIDIVNDLSLLPDAIRYAIEKINKVVERV